MYKNVLALFESVNFVTDLKKSEKNRKKSKKCWGKNSLKKMQNMTEKKPFLADFCWWGLKKVNGVWLKWFFLPAIL